LRNRGEQKPQVFDDRFELESRGRANATGLSGTSEPGDLELSAGAVDINDSGDQ
jgi:hypothetical protein